MIRTVADFDKLDRQLLWLLDQDSSRSISDMARFVRRGSDTVRYRVERFFDSGVVHSAIPVVNLAAFGMSTYKTYVKLRSKPERIAELLAVLSSHQRLYWLAEWYGRWDLVFSFAANSPAEFYDLQRCVLEEYSDCIEETEMTVNTVVHRFPKNYLTGKQEAESVQDSRMQQVLVDNKYHSSRLVTPFI